MPKDEKNHIITKLTRENYKKGLNREQTFQNICRELNYEEYSLHKVKKYFRCLKECTYEMDAIPDERYHQLFMIIEDVYQQMYSGVLSFPLNGVERHDYGGPCVSLLNSRYMLGIKFLQGEHELFLCDMFYGQSLSIDLQLNNGDKNNLKLTVINQNHLLVLQEAKKNRASLIHLIKLDFNQARCTILDTCTNLDDDNLTIITNQLDSKKFVVHFEFAQRLKIVCGSIESGKICIDKEPKIFQQFNSRNVHGIRYTNDCLQVLKFKRPNRKLEIAFHEFKLETEELNSQKLFDLRDNETKVIEDLKLGAYAWQDVCCYFAVRQQERCYKVSTMFFMLDVQKRSLKQLNFSCIGSLDGLHMDTNGILTGIGCEYNTYAESGEKTDRLIVHRFVTNQPDKLTDIIVLKVCRHYQFLKKCQYSLLFKEFPQHLQPLSLCSNVHKDNKSRKQRRSLTGDSQTDDETSSKISKFDVVNCIIKL